MQSIVSLLLVVLSAACFGQDSALSYQDYPMSYRNDLRLHPDGRYTFRYSGCHYAEIDSGYYSRVNDTLFLESKVDPDISMEDDVFLVDFVQKHKYFLVEDNKLRLIYNGRPSEDRLVRQRGKFPLHRRPYYWSPGDR